MTAWRVAWEKEEITAAYLLKNLRETLSPAAGMKVAVGMKVADCLKAVGVKVADGVKAFGVKVAAGTKVAASVAQHKEADNAGLVDA